MLKTGSYVRLPSKMNYQRNGIRKIEGEAWSERHQGTITKLETTAAE